MERRVDDNLLHDTPDTETDEHWWRVIDLLDLVGACNPEKFQFSHPVADFAGFCLTEDSIEPLQKYLDAIRSFPVPKTTTDI